MAVQPTVKIGNENVKSWCWKNGSEMNSETGLDYKSQQKGQTSGTNTIFINIVK